MRAQAEFIEGMILGRPVDPFNDGLTIFQPTVLGGLLSSYGVAQFSFIVAAVWWIVFAWPLLRYGHQRYSVTAVRNPLTDSLRRLVMTFRHIKQYRRVTWFLVAYFFYIDGVDTIFTMATAIGKDMGVDTTTRMIFLLVVQLIAFPFSLLYGWLARRKSSRAAVLTGICVYLFICLYAAVCKIKLEKGRLQEIT